MLVTLEVETEDDICFLVLELSLVMYSSVVVCSSGIVVYAAIVVPGFTDFCVELVDVSTSLVGVDVTVTVAGVKYHK